MMTKKTRKLELIGHRTKIGMLKNVGVWAIVGFVAVAFGLYSPPANADTSVGYVNGQQPVIVITNPGSTVGYVNGEQVIYQGGVGVTQSGQKIIMPDNTLPQQPYYDSTPTQDAQPQNTKTKKPKSRIDELNAAIKQNPNNASLYIQKTEEQIKNKATPQKIINTLETARKYKNQMTNSDNETITYALAQTYHTLKYFKKS